MGWLAPRPGRFTPGKETRYPLYRRLGGPQGRSGRMRKISPPPGFDPRTVQPVASRYRGPRRVTVLTLILRNDCSVSRPGRLSAVKNTGTQRIGGWTGPRTSLEVLK
jgi:hypothetical protein